MKTGINIEAPTSSPEQASYVAGAIVEIFQVGYETRQTESVMLKALDVIQKNTSIAAGPVSISGAHIQDDSVNR